MAGRKKVLRALGTVVHGSAHAQVSGILARGVSMPLEQALAESFIVGLAVGLRVAVADITCGRDILRHLERDLATERGTTVVDESTAKLLEAASS